jgi:hypothetical protein
MESTTIKDEVGLVSPQQRSQDLILGHTAPIRFPCSDQNLSWEHMPPCNKQLFSCHHFGDTL